MADVIGDESGWDAVQAAIDAQKPPSVVPGHDNFGWTVATVVNEDGRMTAHCLPVNDIRDHELSEDCAYGVTEDLRVDDSFIHASWDGREGYGPGGTRRHN